MDYVRYWTKRAELPAKQILAWMQLGASKYHQWKHRYGKANEHNAEVPRDWWLEDWEKEAILGFHDRHPLDGYRSLAFQMLDDDIVAVIAQFESRGGAVDSGDLMNVTRLFSTSD